MTLRRDYPNGKWTLYVFPRASDSCWFSISFDGRRPVSGEASPPVLSTISSPSAGRTATGYFATVVSPMG